MTEVIGFAGFSGSGKTTLIARLVERLAVKGLRTAVIKHDAHGHYKEAAGTDSALYKEAGAAATVVVSPEAYVAFRREAVNLEAVIRQLDLEDSYDLILVEGFKNESHPKIAVFRNAEQAEILRILPTAPVAAAAPQALRALAPESIPFIDLNDVETAAEWLERRVSNNSV
jgi:molybdopterin-guanine dinucleotide biosynthesis protein B